MFLSSTPTSVGEIWFWCVLGKCLQSYLSPEFCEFRGRNTYLSILEEFFLLKSMKMLDRVNSMKHPVNPVDPVNPV